MAKYTVANVNTEVGGDGEYDYTKILLVIIALIVIFYLVKALNYWACGAGMADHPVVTVNGTREGFMVASDNNYQTVNGYQQVI
jgi:hypothetical protein